MVAGQVTHLLTKLTGKLFSPNFLFLTNTGISFGLSGLGDLIQQGIEKRKQTVPKTSVNWSRTLHMSTSFGLTSGVLCHFWYSYLDRVLPGKGLRVVVQKVAWDQVLFSPVCITACLLVSQGLRDSLTTSQFLGQTLQLGGRLYLAEWVIWPPAQFVNFYFLPPHYRVLYDNLVSLTYDTYTSHILHTKELGLKVECLPSSRHYSLVLDLGT